MPSKGGPVQTNESSSSRDAARASASRRPCSFHAGSTCSSVACERRASDRPVRIQGGGAGGNTGRQPFWTESTGGARSQTSRITVPSPISPRKSRLRSSASALEDRDGRRRSERMRIPPQLEPFLRRSGLAIAKDFGGGQEYQVPSWARDSWFHRWLHRHQQPRRRGRGQDRGRVQGRLDTARRDHRPRSATDIGLIKGEGREAADGASFGDSKKLRPATG